RNGVLVAVTLVAAVLAILALWANSQRSRAEGEKDRAETAEQEALRQASIGLAAQAVAELESDTPERGVLLVLEALEHFPYTPQAERALAQIVYATRPYINLTSSEIDPATIRAASFSSNGARVATTADEYDGVIWDAEMGQALMLVGDEYLRPGRKLMF
ncbi:MAG: hypothetical protein M5U05_17890, partial [Anaerolineales bacterium]|nr:hypothetical protein [Anaerolineales bacterium]